MTCDALDETMRSCDECRRRLGLASFLVKSRIPDNIIEK